MPERLFGGRVRQGYVLALLLAVLAALLVGRWRQYQDRVATFRPPPANADYVIREAMIPMRDGVRLHAVIVVPKSLVKANGAQHAPILLTRTPYGARRRTMRAISASMRTTLPPGDGEFADAGYIRIYEDVRGRYESEGDYVVTQPLRGALNATATDHSTDAYDTIDWLVKNVPESNGRVGMLGSSYDGYTAAMALVNPHPALKAVASENPMGDGWMGDDFFHYGAFRQVNFDFVDEMQRGGFRLGPVLAGPGADDYEDMLHIGSAGDVARALEVDSLPLWRAISGHPAYDAFWQGQALDRVVGAQPLKVPTLWVHGLWDQEDLWGGIHCYAAVEPHDLRNDMNYLVIGPWRHAQFNTNGSWLGPLRWNEDTAGYFRREVLRPFFDRYLLDRYLIEGAPRANLAPVFAYNTGAKQWERYDSWPPSTSTAKPLYLQRGFSLDFKAPSTRTENYDEFVSDPGEPVPYQVRTTRRGDALAWANWLLDDQRFLRGRRDVLTYMTEPLTAPLHIAGTPQVNLVASTSGTDSDWVVKLIDVYPDAVPSKPEMGGYELGIAMDIFRGRYRSGFDKPEAIAANQPLVYRFALPTANHVFERGHRIMVQIQSSWFPLYDRNPQTFVQNIFFAKPADYQKATQRVYRDAAHASAIELPVAPGN